MSQTTVESCDLELGRFVLQHRDIDKCSVKNSDNDLVAERYEGGMSDVGPGGLLGNGLDLVSLRKAGCQIVKQNKYCAGNPPEDDLDGKGSDQVDQVVVVRVDDVRPERGHLDSGKC